MTTSADHAARRCRTPQDAFAAGWEDGADDRPLSPQEISRIAALWRPYYRPTETPTADSA